MNYLKSLTIVVEIIPSHKEWKEIQGRRTERSMDYWILRKVFLSWLVEGLMEGVGHSGVQESGRD